MKRVAIDLDGTAWSHIELFKAIIKGLKDYNYEVGILTAHVNLREKDLNLWRSRGLPEVDFYYSKIRGEEHIPSKEWKIMMCNRHNIHYLFDDFDTEEIKLLAL